MLSSRPGAPVAVVQLTEEDEPPGTSRPPFSVPKPVQISKRSWTYPLLFEDIAAFTATTDLHHQGLTAGAGGSSPLSGPASPSGDFRSAQPHGILTSEDFCWEDRFVDLAPLARGGFGRVYSAVDTLNRNRKVALKMESIGSRHAVLLEEAKVLQKLQGLIGVPRLFGYGVQGIQNVMVMEMVGPSMAQMLARHGSNEFDVKTWVLIALQMLRILEGIHKAGYVHRDVKPRNFALTMPASSEPGGYSGEAGAGKYGGGADDYTVTGLLSHNTSTDAQQGSSEGDSHTLSFFSGSGRELGLGAKKEEETATTTASSRRFGFTSQRTASGFRVGAKGWGFRYGKCIILLDYGLAKPIERRTTGSNSAGGSALPGLPGDLDGTARTKTAGAVLVTKQSNAYKSRSQQFSPSRGSNTPMIAGPLSNSNRGNYVGRPASREFAPPARGGSNSPLQGGGSPVLARQRGRSNDLPSPPLGGAGPVLARQRGKQDQNPAYGSPLKKVVSGQEFLDLDGGDNVIAQLSGGRRIANIGGSSGSTPSPVPAARSKNKNSDYAVQQQLPGTRQNLLLQPANNQPPQLEQCAIDMLCGMTHEMVVELLKRGDLLEDFVRQGVKEGLAVGVVNLNFNNPAPPRPQLAVSSFPTEASETAEMWPGGGKDRTSTFSLLREDFDLQFPPQKRVDRAVMQRKPSINHVSSRRDQFLAALTADGAVPGSIRGDWFRQVGTREVIQEFALSAGRWYLDSMGSSFLTGSAMVTDEQAMQLANKDILQNEVIPGSILDVPGATGSSLKLSRKTSKDREKKKKATIAAGPPVVRKQFSREDYHGVGAAGHYHALDNNAFVGTVDFASPGAHDRDSVRYLDEVDDLYGLGYTLVALMNKGKLPWSRPDSMELEEQVGVEKRNISAQALCANCPHKFLDFFDYLRELRPEYCESSGTGGGSYGNKTKSSTIKGVQPGVRDSLSTTMSRESSSSTPELNIDYQRISKLFLEIADEEEINIQDVGYFWDRTKSTWGDHLYGKNCYPRLLGQLEQRRRFAS
ncbi:unnamed protein product [Amoebophrya sp. A120]|nr:unnamed protein product [Amoebophrya sp. A120]|eukprot:GSA120T00002714001.1